MQNVRDYIKENYENPISISELSSQFNRSKTSLCINFKKEIGETIMEYLWKVRIERAKDLLKSRTLLSNEDIAFSCGFSEVSHFYRRFKKHTGLTPSLYLQSKVYIDSGSLLKLSK